MSPAREPPLLTRAAAIFVPPMSTPMTPFTSEPSPALLIVKGLHDVVQTLHYEESRGGFGVERSHRCGHRRHKNGCSSRQQWRFSSRRHSRGSILGAERGGPC